MALFRRRSTESEEAESTGQVAATSEVAEEQSVEEQSGGSSGGWFSRFRQGLKKTSQVLNTDIRDLFKQEGRLVDDDFLGELFAALVRTDMGGGPAGDIRDGIQKEFRGRVVTMDELLDHVKQKLRELMAQDEAPVQLVDGGTTVIMVVGVNGSGKTTSIAKLAYLFHSQGKKVCAGGWGDTFRAAAVASNYESGRSGWV